MRFIHQVSNELGNGFLLMYAAIDKFNILADQFWLVLTLMHASSYILYYWRMKWLQARVTSLAIS